MESDGRDLGRTGTRTVRDRPPRRCSAAGAAVLCVMATLPAAGRAAAVREEEQQCAG